MTRVDAAANSGADAGGRPPPLLTPRVRAIVAAALAVAGGLAWFFAPRLARRAEDGVGEGPAPAAPSATAPATATAGPTARFEEAAAAAGIAFRSTFLAKEQGEKFKINLYDHGSGVAVGDYDGDGRDDVYFLNQLGANALYRNEGGGRFADVTARAGDLALADRISVGAVFADYDGDGRQDLYVTTTRAGNVLFHNRGDGTFEDVTEKAGVALVAHSQTASFFDADGDGRLDLLVTNTAKWTLDQLDPETKAYLGPEDLPQTFATSPREQNRFYRNRGDGTFEDLTAASGLAGEGWGGDVAVFDYDEDGDLDVAVGSMFGRVQLYANDGKARFHDVAREVLGATPYGTMGMKVFDADGDGRLDLLVVDMHSDMWMTPWRDLSAIPQRKKLYGPLTLANDAERPALLAAFAKSAGCEPKDLIFGTALYRALGGGRFEEVSDKAGVESLWPWGAATGDFDADGFEDVFVPSGMGYPFPYVRSPLLMSRGDGTFVDRAADAGLDPMPGGDYLKERIGGKKAARSSRCAATADFDGDGRLDLVVNNFNDAAFLLMNRTPGRRWLELKLESDGPNRDAIGARVTLTVGGRRLVRQVQSASGYLAQSSTTLHFGLGDATKVEACEVRWPDGLVQTVERLEVGARNVVREPKR